MNRAYLNLEKHHIEILLQLVEEEVANPTVNWEHAAARYLQVVLEEVLENIDNKM